MNWLNNWRVFLALAIFLIAGGVLRSAWATRRDGFTVDEPWHITAGVAYLRTGEYYLIQSRVRRVMYLFNGLLLLLFALATFRVFAGMVALGSLLFVLIDPTVAAHWPVVITDLPVGLLSVTSVLICIHTLRNWSVANLCLLAITLGLTLSVKHSGLISFGFTGALGLATLLWQFRKSKPAALRR